MCIRDSSQSIFVIWHHRTCFTNLGIAQSKKLLFFYWSAPPFFPPQFCLPIRCGNFSLHCFIHTNCFNHKTLVNDMPCKYRLSTCKKCARGLHTTNLFAFLQNFQITKTIYIFSTNYVYTSGFSSTCRRLNTYYLLLPFDEVCKYAA